MPQPPGANRRRQQHQPNHLVAPVNALLLLTPRFLGLLFRIWFNPRLNHRTVNTFLVLFAPKSKPLLFHRGGSRHSF